jgi:hypothetical protein
VPASEPGGGIALATSLNTIPVPERGTYLMPGRTVLPIPAHPAAHTTPASVPAAAA